MSPKSTVNQRDVSLTALNVLPSVTSVFRLLLAVALLLLVNAATASAEVCSFSDIKKSSLITYSPDYEENEDEGYFMSTGGNERKLYIDSQTKDSILTIEVYGEMGKGAYKFVFNKNLITAEESICFYDNGDFTTGKLEFVEKKTLKTSKEAEKGLREAFLVARESLYRKLRMPIKR